MQDNTDEKTHRAALTYHEILTRNKKKQNKDKKDCAFQGKINFYNFSHFANPQI